MDYLPLEELGPCKRKTTVTVPKDEIQDKLEKSAGELSESAEIRGFRPGHAPKRLVMRQFKQEIEDEVRQEAIAGAFDEILEKESLSLIGQPSIENIAFDPDKELTFDVTFEIRPEFETPEYKNLKVRRPDTSVSGDKVDEFLIALRKRRSVMQTVGDEPVGQDDFVTCDLTLAGPEGEEVFKEENALCCPNGNFVGPHIIEGAGALFVGKKRGESAHGEVTLADGFRDEAHRGKTVTLRADIKDIRRPVMPELDDEFAKSMGAENAEQLRDTVREELQAQNEREAQENLTTQIEDALLEQTHFDLPQDVVDAAIDDTVERQRLNLQMQGIDPDKVLADSDDAEQKDAVKRNVERQFRLDLIVNKIAEAEKIFATEEEIARQAAAMAHRYNIKPEQMIERLERGDHLGRLRAQIRHNKTIEAVLGLADIELPEGTATTPETPAAPDAASTDEPAGDS